MFTITLKILSFILAIFCGLLLKFFREESVDVLDREVNVFNRFNYVNNAEITPNLSEYVSVC